MPTKGFHLRGIVLTWTLLTTTFFWTSTMRIVLKPEISSWSIFAIGGKGSMGEFWFPPLIVIIALFAFYLEGRGKIRPLYHSLLVGWHIAITGIAFFGSLQSDAKISFGTWGINFPIYWLLIPFILFLVLAILLVIQESRNHLSVPVYSWYQINKSLIGIAVLLLPVAFIFFRLGQGFDLMVKIAVIVTIFQWILLVEALGRPNSRARKDSGT